MNGHDDRNGREGGARNAGEGRAAQQVAAGYRSATEALDERPSAHVRAAILAAAAREVGAQPRDTAAGSPSARPPRARSPLRWPMAAAATVLLSSVAVMMASRVEEAQKAVESAAPPVASPTAPPVAAPTSPPVAPSSPPASSAPMADSRSARENAAPITPPPAPSRSVAAEKATAAPPITQPAPPSAAPSAPSGPAASTSGRARAEAAPGPAPFADSPRERSVMQPPPAPPAAAPPAAAPAEPAASSTTAAPAGGLFRDMATLRKPETRTQEQSRQEARTASGSAPGAALGAAQRADSAATDSEEAILSADDWLARIVRLREAGRHAEADAQLQRFRQRHPQVKVPEAALPPTGTR